MRPDPGAAVIRFRRSGRHVLRIHGLECPVRVAALWVSPTRHQRPAPDQRP